jgi:subtilisin family serine protease
MSTIGPRGPNFDRPHFDRPHFDGPRIRGRKPIVVMTTPDDSGPPPPPPPNRSTRGGAGGNTSVYIPPAGENRFVPDEVVIQMTGNPEPLARRHRLVRMEQLNSSLTGLTLYRWRIPDGRSVRSVLNSLRASGVVAQPNFTFSASQQDQQVQLSNAPANTVEGDPAQYTLTKLQLPLAHRLARGNRILVAVIDSGIDATHPEFGGVIADTFDAIPAGEPHAHGTAIAGAIAAHSRLMGVAPAAQVLGVRAFGPSGGGAEGTTFNILKGLDWAAGKGARIVNMSFAGPSDPGLARAMAAARQKGIVLIAAAGNAGAKSPPLFPAADPNVIAVTATDADDKLFAASNRGNHVAIAAPGVDILLPAPGGSYQVSSGTSFAAAHVSGIAALILERRPDLKPDAVKQILLSTAKDLGAKGRDPLFGAGLADAYQAVTSLDVNAASASTSNASASR